LHTYHVARRDILEDFDQEIVFAREVVVRTFATTTGGLIELDQWLTEGQVELKALASIGVPFSIGWKGTMRSFSSIQSICTLLSSHKTDSKDSEWIADLLHHGLLKASFIRAFADSRTA
jgi:transposase